ncbi:hypothetical protein NC653_022098 [Populus alba x Populus x berolinensis]|uniref:Uncharacterized protein n=1 Tax=Populus alba x Populus x berolinensis TaxID=444605 RepID=A0AAD6QFF9_9ROSI|nr:hypothetical protein NC653_022098 [Populus alba x Populus x berolinensis]
MPPFIGNNLNATLNSGSRVSPLCFSRQSVVPAATSTKKEPSHVPALQQNIPGVGMVDHNLTNVVSSPAEDSHSGTSHSPALVEKWRDLFVSNRNTITGPKLLHFSSSCNDLP